MLKSSTIQASRSDSWTWCRIMFELGSLLTSCCVVLSSCMVNCKRNMLCEIQLHAQYADQLHCSFDRKETSTELAANAQLIISPLRIHLWGFTSEDSYQKSVHAYLISQSINAQSASLRSFFVFCARFESVCQLQTGIMFCARFESVYVNWNNNASFFAHGSPPPPPPLPLK